jgi:hypothetical protein
MSRLVEVVVTLAWTRVPSAVGSSTWSAATVGHPARVSTIRHPPRERVARHY